MAMLRTTQDIIKEFVDHAMLNPKKEIQPLLKRIGESSYIDKVRIVDDTGLIHYSSSDGEIGKFIYSVTEDHQHFRQDTSIHILKSNSTYSQVLPIKNEKKCQSCHKQKNVIAYIDVDSKFTHAETFFYTGYRHSLYLGITIILLLIGLLYIFFERVINAPLHKVIQALDELNAGNLQITLPTSGRDEFSVVNKHFNSMASHLANSRDEIDKLHKEQLQRADKLVTLGEIAAEMAHEINNPAGVILTRADYLLLEANDHPGLKNYTPDFETIIKQTERVAKITGNILKYSKKLPKEYSDIDLAKTVSESVSILEPRLKRRNIKLQQSYTCEAKCKAPMIYGDPQQIEQIVINLINNAIDAIEMDGRVTINVSCLTEKKHQLTIEDDGPGMDKSTSEKIFIPFFTTKDAQKGTGLGLYIVRNICHNHNATISCESAVGHGTIFKIIFHG